MGKGFHLPTNSRLVYVRDKTKIPTGNLKKSSWKVMKYVSLFLVTEAILQLYFSHSICVVTRFNS